MKSELKSVANRIWLGLATDDEMQSIGIDNVLAIKSDVEHVRFRECTKSAPRANVELGQIVHVASEESADRVGDVIVVRGWDLKAFQRNPILQRYHKGDALPLGTVPSVKRGKSDNELPALITLSQFFDEDELDEEGRLMRRLVLSKKMPAVSVGFRPLKARRPEDAKERAALGIGEWGVLYESAELLELSVVNVGAHQEAIAKALDEEVDAGRVSRSLADQVKREHMPSTRTVVSVSKVQAEPDTTADEVALATRVASMESQLGECRRLLGQITNTLGAELPALKSLLHTSRQPSLPSAPQGGPQSSTKAEPSGAQDPVAILTNALASLRAKA